MLASIENVHEFPGILVVIDSQFLSLLVDLELAGRQQHARALAFLIAEVQFDGRQVVVHGSAIRPSLAERDRAIGEHAEFETVCGW